MTGVPAPAAPASAGSSFLTMVVAGVIAGGLVYYFRSQARARALEESEARAVSRLEALEAQSWASAPSGYPPWSGGPRSSGYYPSSPAPPPFTVPWGR
jgi:hypothetical protein